MRLFGLPEKGYRGEHFQKDTEPRWDDMGNYFEPETYAECDTEAIKQLVLPGMDAFEHIMGRLVLNGTIDAKDAYDRLRELE